MNFIQKIIFSWNFEIDLNKTVLHLAVTLNEIEIIQALLNRKGIDTDAIDEI